MCGLVGVAGHLQIPDEDAMKFLLLADYFRGTDATGIAAIRTNGDASICKLNSNPIDTMGLAQFKVALNGYNSRAFIGHNRAATRGKNVSVNAHPFHIDHIVGAHNGTLTTESHRALEKELGATFEVDSMALFAAIAKLGIDETLKLITEGQNEREGAWALTWYDQAQGTLNFLRNKWRPLYYAYASYKEEKEFRRLFWASEWWMIREAMTAPKVNYGLYTERQKDSTVGYFSFEPDVLYKYPLEALCKNGDKIPKPIVKAKMKGKEAAKVTRPANPTHTWPGTPGTTNTGVGSRKSTYLTTTCPGKTKEVKRIIQLTGYDDDPYAGLVDETKFHNICPRKCCQHCNRPVSFGDSGITIIEREGMVLCRKCTGYPDDVSDPPSKIYLRANIMDELEKRTVNAH